MVALPPGDEVAAGGLTDFDEVLPGHFQGGLDRLRSAGHEVGPGKTAGLVPDQLLGQRLRGFGREETRMGVGERLGLAPNGFDHARVLVTKAAHRRAAGRV